MIPSKTGMKNLVESWFLPIQVVLIGSSVTLAAFWYRDVNHRVRLPDLNDQPRTVRPLHDYPLVVSDTQLASVLEKLHPKFSENPTKVNFIDHALRLWGPSVEFEDGGAAIAAAFRARCAFDKAGRAGRDQPRSPLFFEP